MIMILIIGVTIIYRVKFYHAEYMKGSEPEWSKVKKLKVHLWIHTKVKMFLDQLGTSNVLFIPP